MQTNHFDRAHPKSGKQKPDFLKEGQLPKVGAATFKVVVALFHGETPEGTLKSTTTASKTNHTNKIEQSLASKTPQAGTTFESPVHTSNARVIANKLE